MKLAIEQFRVSSVYKCLTHRYYTEAFHLIICILFTFSIQVETHSWSQFSALRRVYVHKPPQTRPPLANNRH